MPRCTELRLKNIQKRKIREHRSRILHKLTVELYFFFFGIAQAAIDICRDVVAKKPLGKSKIPFEKRHAPLLSGQALHARRLSLTHPRSGERMQFECPLPKEFQKLIEILKNENS